MYNNIEKVKLAVLSMQRYSWEQAVCAQAFLEIGDTQTVIPMCYEAINRQSKDGRLANIGEQTSSTDPVAILEPMLKAYKITNDSKIKNAIDKSINWAINEAPRSSEGIVYHVDNAPQIWVDSMYMLPPALLSAGYADEAVLQANGIIKSLYDGKFFSHIWDEGNKRFVREAHWGVGNGWALCGLTRLVQGLTAEHADDIAVYKKIINDCIQASLKHITDDYLFHDVIDDASTFVEVNFAQMICYAIAKGVKGGYLDNSLLETAHSIRAAVYKNVDEYGFVQNVCGAPTFDKPGIAPEGQAFFILMEAAFNEAVV